METLTLYVCGICGWKSRDKERIARCEARGYQQPKYAVGQWVIYSLYTRGKLREVTAKIMRVLRPKKESHGIPTYSVRTQSELKAPFTFPSRRVVEECDILRLAPKPPRWRPYSGDRRELD